MECQKPNIAEKLVPFVEGALADADRREVMEHLPQCPVCSQEAKSLRQVVSLLRETAGKTLNYYPASPMAPADVIDYALQADKMSDTTRRRMQLQLVESLEAQQEVEWLRELEQDLNSKDELIRVPLMPDALRATIGEVYGVPDSSKKAGLATLLSGWLARVGPRPVVAGAVGCLFAAFTVHAAFFNKGPATAPASLAVASVSPTKAPLPVVSPSESPRPTSAKDQVALLPEKVLPEELPRLSRLLWEKKVNHTYRDGQIFVAAEDVDQAWAALNMNEGRLVAASELKANKVGDKEAEAGFATSSGNAGRPTSKPHPVTPPALGRAQTLPPYNAKSSPPATGHGGHEARRVTYTPPPTQAKSTATPATHKADQAPGSHKSDQPPAHAIAYHRPEPPKPASKPAPKASSALPPAAPAKVAAKAPPLPTHVAVTSKAPAPEKPHLQVALNQNGYNAPRQQQSVAVQSRVEPPARPVEVAKKVDVIAPQPTPKLAEKPREVAAAPPPGPVTNVATTPDVLRKNSAPAPTEVHLPTRPAAPGGGLSAPVTTVTPSKGGEIASRPAAQPATQEERKDSSKEDGYVGAPVQRAKVAAVPSKMVNEQKAESKYEGASSDLKPVPKWNERDKSNAGAKQSFGDTSPAGTAGKGPRLDIRNDDETKDRKAADTGALAAGSARSSGSSGTVLRSQHPAQGRQGVLSAGAMTTSAPADGVEVAMLTNAKKIVVDTIGEAEVLIERRDDGSMMVTVKPSKALNQFETEQLRKLLRKKLKLDDADSVVIRQP